MSALFVDTSALVKRYINEVGSTWLLTQIQLSAGNLIVVSELASVEIFSAFARREREGVLAPQLIQIICNDFLYHFENEYLVVDLDRSIIAKARELITAYPLRTLDAVQLSCAIYAKTALNTSFTFIASDHHLLTVASNEGFRIDNPNLHL